MYDSRIQAALGEMCFLEEIVRQVGKKVKPWRVHPHPASPIKGEEKRAPRPELEAQWLVCLLLFSSL